MFRTCRHPGRNQPRPCPDPNISSSSTWSSPRDPGIPRHSSRLSQITNVTALGRMINIKFRGVPNCGFRLFGRIRIVLRTIRTNKNTNSVAGWAFWRCTCCSDIYHLLMSLANYGCACMLSSHDPLPFIRLIVSQNQAVWTRAAGTDWVKSAVDVTSCSIHVQTNYLYSFWRHYSS